MATVLTNVGAFACLTVADFEAFREFGVLGAAGMAITFVAYVTVKVRSTASGILESLSYLSFSFPGIVIGIGFMWFFVHTPLYATIWSLLVGYIATYLPYGLRPLTSAFTSAALASHVRARSMR